jgi:UDP-N-acetylmuramyl pentapeptide synthase
MGKDEKELKRRILERALRLMARLVLKRYHPVVIGVTGSVGKSSAKEAISVVLSSKRFLWKSEGNYNNEIGVPLAILGTESGGGSIVKWLHVSVRFLRLLFLPNHYPETLVLEMGVDRPGDMSYLLGIAPVKIGVVTRIASSHLVFFGNVGNIAREKGRLISTLPQDGFAILNADDPRVLRMREKTKGVVITYGFSPESMVRADNLIFQGGEVNSGWSFKLNYDGKTLPVRLPNVLAKHQIEDALAGAAVGIALGMNLVEIASALERIVPLPGRLRALSGRSGSTILDDTYNASPASTEAALGTLGEIPAMRKIVILGDMLELGAESEESHRNLAKSVFESRAEFFLAVGNRMRFAQEELVRLGFPERQTLWFPDPVSAARVAADIIRDGDLVLVKGSRGMRMEKVSEVLLRDPGDAATLLCSQSRAWRSRPFMPPAEWGDQ